MKVFRYLIGPELIWIIAAISAAYFKRLAQANAGKYDGFIEGSTLLPVGVLALTLCLYLIPGIPRPWLFMRIALAAVIGTHFVMTDVLDAHSKGGPGIGTIYIVAYLAMIVAIPVAFGIKSFLFK